MIEPIVEGGGCIAGLAALYYFEIWRPARRAAGKTAEARAAPAVEPVPSGERDTTP